VQAQAVLIGSRAGPTDGLAEDGAKMGQNGPA
jgi:hypothetical protein